MAKKNPKIDKKIKSQLGKKEPREGVNVRQYLQQTPNWQIRLIDNEGDWSWNKVNQKTWGDDILPKLANYESMTWAEIEQASGGRKRGNNSHFVARNKLSKEAQKRLKELKMDDIDELYSLRLAGKPRIIGKRVGNTLQIMWFDFNHEVVATSKK